MSSLSIGAMSQWQLEILLVLWENYISFRIKVCCGLQELELFCYLYLLLTFEVELVHSLALTKTLFLNIWWEQINPKAKVSVKLVAEAGIGTVASGVSKGNADIIQVG